MAKADYIVSSKGHRLYCPTVQAVDWHLAKIGGRLSSLMMQDLTPDTPHTIRYFRETQDLLLDRRRDLERRTAVAG